MPKYGLCLLLEEFPEYVGSKFNDTFMAEIGGTNLIINGNQVIAPLNFAFDTEGNIISINTVFGVAPNTGTTYDASTQLLTAQTAVVPGSTVDLVFSVMDLGDSVWDTAVFMDNFSWSDSPTCEGGSTLATYAISGQITNLAGKGITGVTITATSLDGTAYKAVTNSNGYYILHDLPEGSYSLKPTKTGYVFKPEENGFSLASDVTGIDFKVKPPLVLVHGFQASLGDNPGFDCSIFNTSQDPA